MPYFRKNFPWLCFRCQGRNWIKMGNTEHPGQRQFHNPLRLPSATAVSLQCLQDVPEGNLTKQANVDLNLNYMRHSWPEPGNIQSFWIGQGIPPGVKQPQGKSPHSQYKLPVGDAYSNTALGFKGAQSPISPTQPWNSIPTVPGGRQLRVGPG